MVLTITSDPVPLTIDADGVIRVRGTRVTLDSVIWSFLDGAAAEEIALQYPSLELADIYSVISYYLRRRNDVDEYLKQRAEQAEKIRDAHRVQFGLTEIREQLLQRRKKA